MTPDCQDGRTGKGDWRRAKSSRASTKGDYLQWVAETLVEAIENGTAPWVQACEPGGKILPYNVKTVKTYRDGNCVFRAAEASKRGFGDECWGTHKQVKSLGGQVRKGECGYAILFWQFDRTRTARDERGKPLLDAAGFFGDTISPCAYRQR